ncbi:MAG: OmpA family protein [Amphiplicatus sp.]
MSLKATLFVAAATLALAPAAHAYEGLYGAIGAGITHIAADRDVKTVTSPRNFEVDADYQNGVGIYGALGYEYGNGWRTELEFNHRDNDARHWTSMPPVFSGFSGGALSGGISSWAFMANILRDFNPDQKINPYIGAGIGFAQLNAELSGAAPGAANGLTPLVVDDRHDGFAYQAIAGVAIGLAENLSLDISYRYFRTLGDAQFSGTLAGAPLTFDTVYDSHNLFAGLRWNFGGSAPAKVQYKDCWDGSSVPVTAECPPQLVEKAAAVPEPIEVIVYFDYDKFNLTPEASALIRETSQRALASDINAVRVEGNADRSGSSAYNQALSQKRANVVRDALVANGVPAETITTTAYGEDNPAKPTPDGVREPLNRRT